MECFLDFLRALTFEIIMYAYHLAAVAIYDHHVKSVSNFLCKSQIAQLMLQIFQEMPGGKLTVQLKPNIKTILDATFCTLSHPL